MASTGKKLLRVAIFVLCALGFVAWIVEMLMSQTFVDRTVKDIAKMRIKSGLESALQSRLGFDNIKCFKPPDDSEIKVKGVESQWRGFRNGFVTTEWLATSYVDVTDFDEKVTRTNFSFWIGVSHKNFHRSAMVKTDSPPVMWWLSDIEFDTREDNK